eukprot:7416824-Pyramimonas_sp.AAC.1
MRPAKNLHVAARGVSPPRAPPNRSSSTPPKVSRSGQAVTEQEVAQIAASLKQKAVGIESAKAGFCTGNGEHAPRMAGREARPLPTALAESKPGERNRAGEKAIFLAWESGSRCFKQRDVIGCRFRRELDTNDLLRKRWEKAQDEEKFKEEWMKDQYEAIASGHTPPSALTPPRPCRQA